MEDHSRSVLARDAYHAATAADALDDLLSAPLAVKPGCQRGRSRVESAGEPPSGLEKTSGRTGSARRRERIRRISERPREPLEPERRYAPRHDDAMGHRTETQDRVAARTLELATRESSNTWRRTGPLKPCSHAAKGTIVRSALAVCLSTPWAGFTLEAPQAALLTGAGAWPPTRRFRRPRERPCDGPVRSAQSRRAVCSWASIQLPGLLRRYRQAHGIEQRPPRGRCRQG